MRIERAVDELLDWRRLERDATPRSAYSYRRILDKLAENYPELDLRRFTKQDLLAFLKRWDHKGAATRANVVSVLHSFLGWATTEDLIEVDPSAPLRRQRSGAPISITPVSRSSRTFGRLHFRTSFPRSC
jgi:site-specific recombinase XerD